MEMPPSAEIKVLFVLQTSEGVSASKTILENLYRSQLKANTLELLPAIERLEDHHESFQLMIVEQQTTIKSLLRLLLSLSRGKPVIVCGTGENEFLEDATIDSKPEWIQLSELENLLPGVLKRLAATMKIPDFLPPGESDYVSFEASSVLAGVPLKHDVYIRMSQGRYVCVFKKGDGVEKADFQNYQEKKSIDLFYMKKNDCQSSLLNQAAVLDQMSASAEIKPTEAAKQFSNAYQMMSDLVGQIGFTSEAQMVAKSSVAMSLKVIGTHPKLSKILTDLKKKDGNYIATHSFLLGQVACALAHQIGWNSATTFFKLTLAAFLHDIALSDVTLAKIPSYEEAKESGRFSHEQLQAIRFHPVKAAEYSKQFSEIPSDIDTMVSQHHERPDGRGFPRELNGKNLSPLTALFIIAHDLVEYLTDDPGHTVQDFVSRYGDRYQVGQFKKIMAQLLLE